MKIPSYMVASRFEGMRCEDPRGKGNFGRTSLLERVYLLLTARATEMP